MNDEQKMTAVLEVLNEARRSARSPSMMELTTAQVHSKVKRKPGLEDFTYSDALVALDYMSGNQVKLSNTEHPVGMTAVAMHYAKSITESANPFVTSIKWKITQKGIVQIEGLNAFTSLTQTSQITLNAHNSQVIVGNENIITGNIEVVDRLTELQQIISESENINIEERQNVFADIDSVKAQLSKPKPALDVIKSLWIPISLAADSAGAAQLAMAIAGLIGL
jgi:hypothetical protein